MATGKPTIYLIAGCNGAGKTTFAKEFLPKEVKCLRFLNADQIARGLSPLQPAPARSRQRACCSSKSRNQFGARRRSHWKSTLSGLTYVRVFRFAKRRGY